MSLPDTHPNPVRMARALVSYIDCPLRVRREVLAEFQQAPALHRIREFRAEHLAARERARERPHFKPYEGYYPDEERRLAEHANLRFVEALRMARR